MKALKDKAIYIKDNSMQEIKFKIINLSIQKNKEESILEMTILIIKQVKNHKVELNKEDFIHQEVLWLLIINSAQLNSLANMMQMKM